MKKKVIKPETEKSDVDIEFEAALEGNKTRDLFNKRCGDILSMALSVETDLDFFISNYFCFPPNYKTFILNDVMVKNLEVSFAKKIEVFKRICDEEKFIIAEYEKISGEDEIKKIVEAIEYVRDTKNTIAQWLGFIEKSNEGIQLQKRSNVEFHKSEFKLTTKLVEEVRMNRLAAQFGINKVYFALNSRNMKKTS